MKRGITVWMTGLSGAGKSTIAQRLYENLVNEGWSIEILDGDVLRNGICRDLGFSKEDRRKQLERVTYIADLLSRNGIVTLVSLISPYSSDRKYARDVIKNFQEVYVKCPLDVCISRDVKGLYKRAISGEIKNFTGISDPYEEPEKPELVLDTSLLTIDECVSILKTQIIERSTSDSIDIGGHTHAI